MLSPRTLAIAGALSLAPLSAAAQPLRAPWTPSDPPPPSASSDVPLPTARSWPTVRVPPTPAAPAVAAPAAPHEPYESGSDHHFQLPTARPLRLGDLMGHYIGHLGWVGMRYGLTRSIDVGVGVPYYFAGVSADARIAFVNRPGLAISWWAYVSVPLRPEGEYPTSNLGFTWAYAGLGWLMGPLVSVWTGRVGLHLGAHAAQRTGLGGLWFVGHVTADVRVTDNVKAIVQSMAFYELSEEEARGARALLGNGRRRFMPYVLGGVRFHTRRFAADVGALMPLSEQAPLYSQSLAVLPWMSLSHLF